MSELDDRANWLSVMQAARAAGISRRHMYNWLDQGKVEYTRTVGGRVRINPASLWTEPTREWVPTRRSA